MSAAYDLGKELGRRPEVIGQDLSRAKLEYLNSHRSAAQLDGLRDDVTECLGDDYGRPND